MSYKLTIPVVEVLAFIGCWPGEQDQEQKIQFLVEIEIHSEYKASISDQISDAVDYADIANILVKTARQKKYNLIEHLLHDAVLNVEELLMLSKVQGQLRLTCKKINIPISTIKDGVLFQCQKTISSSV